MTIRGLATTTAPIGATHLAIDLVGATHSPSEKRGTLLRRSVHRRLVHEPPRVATMLSPAPQPMSEKVLYAEASSSLIPESVITGCAP